MRLVASKARYEKGSDVGIVTFDYSKSPDFSGSAHRQDH
jgi:hypothetical protein